MNDNKIRALLISQSHLIGNSVDQLLYFALNTSRIVESKCSEKLYQTSKSPKNELFMANIRTYQWETECFDIAKCICIKVIKLGLMRKRFFKLSIRGGVPGFGGINSPAIFCYSISKFALLQYFQNLMTLDQSALAFT